MGFDLQIYNPSDYARTGFVTIPWQIVGEKTGIQPEEVTLYGASKETPLLAQVDDIDPSDPTRKTLVFMLDEEVPPGPDDYFCPSASVSVQRGEQRASAVPDLEVKRAEDDRVIAVALSNERLRVAFSLIPSPADDLGHWYSGSAPAVQLDGKEMLDLFSAPFPELHDREKRCMQIEQIRVWNPAWEESAYREIALFDKPFELISECVGPVRTSITVASEAFDYDFADLYAHEKRSLRCQLYRIISLYTDADFVMEELFVKAKREGDTANPQATTLNFIARYFSYIGLGFLPEIYRFPNIPDWFALGQPNGDLREPHPGYGFATDVHTGPIAHPHPGFHDPEESYKSFSWELMPAKRATCLHLFMHGQPGGFDSRIGHHWYEHVYKPLRAGFDSVA